MTDLLKIAFPVAMFAAWGTAVFHSATTSNVVMLILDLIIPPIGLIHGVMIWMGAA